MWDLPTVLQGLMADPFEPLEELSLQYLTLKTVFLVAVCSVRRIGELEVSYAFRRCEVQGCNRPMPSYDGHIRCVACLGEGHSMSKCNLCQAIPEPIFSLRRKAMSIKSKIDRKVTGWNDAFFLEFPDLEAALMMREMVMWWLLISEARTSQTNHLGRRGGLLRLLGGIPTEKRPWRVPLLVLMLLREMVLMFLMEMLLTKMLSLEMMVVLIDLMVDLWCLNTRRMTMVQRWNSSEMFPPWLADCSIWNPWWSG
jgi:hypothetical protein